MPNPNPQQGYRIVTFTWSMPYTEPPYEHVVNEQITGTYTIFQPTLEKALEVLRRTTQDQVRSAQYISESILY